MEKKTIGAFISALRKANGITQQELADRLNISNKAVSRWERDECAPDITLIPALAEILGVTCDELLKGERILSDKQQDKSEPKVEKQIKAIINRSISSYKTLVCISWALSALGFVAMYGITYGFYRLMVGFITMCVLEITAVAMAVIGMVKLKDIKRENELFEIADAALINRYNKTLGIYSYVALFSPFAVIALSAPLFNGYYNGGLHEYILSFERIFELFWFVVPALGFLFLILKDPFCALITGQPYKRPERSKNSMLVLMNILQLGAVILGCVLCFVSPLIKSEGGRLAINVVGMCILSVVNFVLFLIFIFICKSERNKFVLHGLRNISLIIPSIFILLASENYRNEWGLWDINYLLHALGFIFIVCFIFQLIITVMRSKQKL